jgi:mono/diheme cytochrome c family protein
VIALSNSKLPLRITAFAVLALLGTALVSGCDDRYTSDMRYPQRTDPIVTGLFKSVPKRFDNPGVFPHLLAEVPDQSELKANVIEMNDPAFTPELHSKLGTILEKTFGTPAQPKVDGIDEQTKKDLVLDDETLAGGAKYYRLHCLHCHGLSGNGHGPTSPWVNPHPRDYRQGLFKFTSSAQADKVRKPRREDLIHTLKVGIEGTSMPTFGLLSDKDLNELVSYVIHLSIRGELEMTLLKQIKSPSNPDETITAQNMDEQAKSWLSLIVSNWTDAPKKAIVPTDDFPTDLKASVPHGYELFMKTCAACHLDFGRNPTLMYDSWGTIVRPADLTQGVYRGGRRRLDLYYRVDSGINGANMAAAPTNWTPKDKWDVVSFIQLLPYREMLRKDYGIDIDK